MENDSNISGNWGRFEPKILAPSENQPTLNFDDQTNGHHGVITDITSITRNQKTGEHTVNCEGVVSGYVGKFSINGLSWVEAATCRRFNSLMHFKKTPEGKDADWRLETQKAEAAYDKWLADREILKDIKILVDLRNTLVVYPTEHGYTNMLEAFKAIYAS
jgi:hypothetical protein